MQPRRSEHSWPSADGYHPRGIRAFSLLLLILFGRISHPRLSYMTVYPLRYRPSHPDILLSLVEYRHAGAPDGVWR
jgi:hypothetical protein